MSTRSPRPPIRGARAAHSERSVAPQRHEGTTTNEVLEAVLLRLTEQPAARLTDSLKSLLHYGHPSVGDGTLSYLLGRLSAPECSPTLQVPMVAAWGLADGRCPLDMVPGYG